MRQSVTSLHFTSIVIDIFDLATDMFHMSVASCHITERSISITYLCIRTSDRTIQFIFPARGRLDTILALNTVNDNRCLQREDSNPLLRQTKNRDLSLLFRPLRKTVTSAKSMSDDACLSCYGRLHACTRRFWSFSMTTTGNLAACEGGNCPTAN